MGIEFTNIFALQNLPKFGFFGLTIWHPANHSAVLLPADRVVAIHAM
jgi:hypothetical protein